MQSNEPVSNLKLGRKSHVLVTVLLENILPDATGEADRQQTYRILGLIQHDWRGRADGQDNGVPNPLALQAVPCIHRALGGASLFALGVFSNKYMQYAVGLSIGLLLLVTAPPSCRSGRNHKVFSAVK